MQKKGGGGKHELEMLSARSDSNEHEKLARPTDAGRFQNEL